MPKTIELKLDSGSIQNAIYELNQYNQMLEQKRDELVRELGDIGVNQADILFTNAPYDGTKEIEVSVETSVGEESYTATIIAQGEAVCFIEFGAGIHYNSGLNYPPGRPEGIVGIGEYGKGQGKNDSWLYKGEPGTNGVPSTKKKGMVYTHGNEASMPMYSTMVYIQQRVIETARKVFGGDA